MVIAAAKDAYDVYNAENIPREATIKTFGWAGAWAGSELGFWAGGKGGAAVGVWADGVGALPGGVIGSIGGSIIGGIGGYAFGTNTSETVYDWAFSQGVDTSMCIPDADEQGMPSGDDE